MAASIKRICWDACAWIAYIQREEIYKDDKLIENRYALCRSVISLAEKGELEIATSGLSLVEVCKNPAIREKDEDLIKAYFENDYILLVPVDNSVGTAARQLMQQKHTGLKPPDAIHVATALFAMAEEFHTFDGDLLNLDAKLQKRDGSPLQICKPNLGGPPLPLMAAAAEAELKSEGKANVVEQGPKTETEAEARPAPIEGSGGPVGTVPPSGTGT
jgi:predicted nucleic acid-binding protein